MNVTELLSRARDTLQDKDKTYWDDSELLSYYNECKRTMAYNRLENKTTATLTLDPLKSEYDTTGVIRYIKAIDDDSNVRTLYGNDGTGDDDIYGIILIDYNKVYINDSTIGTVITMDVIATPSDDNMSSIVRVGDEEALRYYILSKAYEKDSDMGNFQKSGYFFDKYNTLFRTLKKASSANYRASTVERTVSKGY
jgi:hypothetical protein